jgi:hypothetical protein
MTVLGSLLGKIPLVQRNFEKFVLLVILVSCSMLLPASRGMSQRKPALQPGD